MSAQIMDSIMINNVEYFITDVTDFRRLFIPDEYGLDPTMRCTACYRGYWCRYQIKDMQFHLKDLWMFNGNDQYPLLNGVDILSRRNVAQSQKETSSVMGHEKYADVDLLVPYSGKILVGKDEIYQYRRKGGIQNCWAYETMLECTFENGCLVSLLDYTRVAEMIRDYIDRERSSAMFVKYREIPKEYWGNLKWVLINKM